jgi:hypothetical protein
VSPVGDAGESVAERWRRLDRETRAEAQQAVERGRRFHLFNFARAPLTFFWTLIGRRALLDGTRGLIRAGMSAIHCFVTHLRIWSLQHDAERGGEPHENRPR